MSFALVSRRSSCSLMAKAIAFVRRAALQPGLVGGKSVPQFVSTQGCKKDIQQLPLDLDWMK